jgi:ferredoxin-NADP reductase
MLDLGGHPFPFSPGQAVLVGRPGEAVRKPYAIASSPEDAAAGALELLVKRGAFKGARAGAVLDVEGPFGRFRFPRRVAERQVLFVAGGTGIAPIRSMVRHTLASGYDGRLALAYSARTDRDFAFLAELRRLARAGRVRLHLTASRDAAPGWRGGRGRLDLERLRPLVASPRTLCFVCGPPGFVKGVAALLRRLGVASSRIRVEA